MANFKEKKDGLYIDGKKVIKGWESFSGWYWFATEKIREQLSDLGDGRGTPDTIYFGLVQGLEEEWGDFSEAEIKSLGPMMAWELKGGGLRCAGRR